MVVFTCNHCGDSLQKPKVEKHYLTVCRNAKSVTCVDCFKDFKDEEYAVHIKCVTEEERYAAKGSLPQGVVKKGEVKQESWTEMIKSITENVSEATPGQKRVFEILSSSVNVPRKKNKFVNFIKSSTGGRVNVADVEHVWNMIEKRKAQHVKEAVSSNGAEPAMTEEKLETEDNAASVDVPTKKKSKKSKSKTNEDGEANVSSEAVVTGSATESLKKKKRKSENVQEDNEDVKLKHDSTNGNGEVKVSKKKKRKSENVQTEDNETKEVLESDDVKNGKETKDVATNENVNVETGGGESSKKKKRKSEHLQEKTEDNETKEVLESDVKNDKDNATNENINVETGGGESSKKKKRKSENLQEVVIENGSSEKKKKKHQTPELAAEVTSNGQETKKEINNSAVENSLDSNNFCFAEKILELVKEKNGISLKKLEKKVLSAYCKKTAAELSEKLVKKFNKKLKKVKGIEISENTVRLTS